METTKRGKKGKSRTHQTHVAPSDARGNTVSSEEANSLTPPQVPPRVPRTLPNTPRVTRTLPEVPPRVPILGLPENTGAPQQMLSRALSQLTAKLDLQEAQKGQHDTQRRAAQQQLGQPTAQMVAQQQRLRRQQRQEICQLNAEVQRAQHLIQAQLKTQQLAAQQKAEAEELIAQQKAAEEELLKKQQQEISQLTNEWEEKHCLQAQIRVQQQALLLEETQCAEPETTQAVEGAACVATPPMTQPLSEALPCANTAIDLNAFADELQKASDNLPRDGEHDDLQALIDSIAQPVSMPDAVPQSRQASQAIRQFQQYLAAKPVPSSSGQSVNAQITGATAKPTSAFSGTGHRPVKIAQTPARKALALREQPQSTAHAQLKTDAGVLYTFSGCNINGIKEQVRIAFPKTKESVLEDIAVKIDQIDKMPEVSNVKISGYRSAQSIKPGADRPFILTVSRHRPDDTPSAKLMKLIKQLRKIPAISEVKLAQSSGTESAQAKPDTMGSDKVLGGGGNAAKEQLRKAFPSASDDLLDDIVLKIDQMIAMPGVTDVNVSGDDSPKPKPGADRPLRVTVYSHRPDDAATSGLMGIMEELRQMRGVAGVELAQSPGAESAKAQPDTMAQSSGTESAQAKPDTIEHFAMAQLRKDFPQFSEETLAASTQVAYQIEKIRAMPEVLAVHVSGDDSANPQPGADRPLIVTVSRHRPEDAATSELMEMTKLLSTISGIAEVRVAQSSGAKSAQAQPDAMAQPSGAKSAQAKPDATEAFLTFVGVLYAQHRAKEPRRIPTDVQAGDGSSSEGISTSNPNRASSDAGQGALYIQERCNTINEQTFTIHSELFTLIGIYMLADRVSESVEMDIRAGNEQRYSRKDAKKLTQLIHDIHDMIAQHWETLASLEGFLRLIAADKLKDEIQGLQKGMPGRCGRISDYVESEIWGLLPQDVRQIARASNYIAARILSSLPERVGQISDIMLPLLLEETMLEHEEQFLTSPSFEVARLRLQANQITKEITRCTDKIRTNSRMIYAVLSRRPTGGNSTILALGGGLGDAAGTTPESSGEACKEVLKNLWSATLMEILNAGGHFLFAHHTIADSSTLFTGLPAKVRLLADGHWLADYLGYSPNFEYNPSLQMDDNGRIENLEKACSYLQYLSESCDELVEQKRNGMIAQLEKQHPEKYKKWLREQVHCNAPVKRVKIPSDIVRRFRPARTLPTVLSKVSAGSHNSTVPATTEPDVVGSSAALPQQPKPEHVYTPTAGSPEPSEGDNGRQGLAPAKPSPTEDSGSSLLPTPKNKRKRTKKAKVGTMEPKAAPVAQEPEMPLEATSINKGKDVGQETAAPTLTKGTAQPKLQALASPGKDVGQETATPPLTKGTAQPKLQALASPGKDVGQETATPPLTKGTAQPKLQALASPGKDVGQETAAPTLTRGTAQAASSTDISPPPDPSPTSSKQGAAVLSTPPAFSDRQGSGEAAAAKMTVAVNAALQDPSTDVSTQRTLKGGESDLLTPTTMAMAAEVAPASVTLTMVEGPVDVNTALQIGASQVHGGSSASNATDLDKKVANYIGGLRQTISGIIEVADNLCATASDTLDQLNRADPIQVVTSLEINEHIYTGSYTLSALQSTLASLQSKLAEIERSAGSPPLTRENEELTNLGAHGGHPGLPRTGGDAPQQGVASVAPGLAVTEGVSREGTPAARAMTAQLSGVMHGANISNEHSLGQHGLPRS